MPRHLGPHALQALRQGFHMVHPYALMPYELAEMEESSLALDEAFLEGEAFSAPMPPWGFLR